MKFQTSELVQNRFQDMGLDPILLTAIEKMNITKPTPVQAEALPMALTKQDLIAVAQTGSGKTLVFALATLTVLAKNPEARALVLAPSREMAEQIFQVFSALCAELPVTSCLIMGGTPNAKQVSMLKKIPRLIVATPGRMKDHLMTNKLLLQRVAVVVIDEADRMLDMGFAPQLETIRSTMRGERQTMMFSASFSPGVEKIAKKFLSPSAYMIRANKAEEPVSGLKQKVLLIDRGQKKDQLLIELRATKGPVMVFVGSQQASEIVEQHLKDNGVKSAVIHGGLSQNARQQAVSSFREGLVRVLVTTDLLARGLDIPNLEAVINFDLPYEPEDFLHRIGRTARAGRKGKAITFVVSSDKHMFEKIQPYLAGSEEHRLASDFSFAKKKYFAKGSAKAGERSGNSSRDKAADKAADKASPKFEKQERPQKFDRTQARPQARQQPRQQAKAKR